MTKSLERKISKAQIALDKAKRDVFSLVPRTDVKLSDIRKQFPNHFCLAEYDRLFEELLALHSERKAA